jgi:transcription initiation factor IIE alpha subunit
MAKMDKDSFRFYRCRICGTRFVRTRRFKSEDMSLVDDFINSATPGGTVYVEEKVFCPLCNSEMVYLDNEKVLDKLDEEPWN